jgi:hypothetical protein
MVFAYFSLVAGHQVIGCDKEKSKSTLALFKASAAETEQQKPETNLGQSPMPNRVYDLWHGEGSLINPVKNSVDSQLSELCERFAKSDKTTRARIRAALTDDDFYTLLTFSNRSSVFAIRDPSAGHLINALRAIAMIRLEKIDPRDILRVLALIYHSAERTKQNPDKLFRDALTVSESKMSTLMVDFLKRSPQDKDLRSSWGYDEVETKNGIGFIDREFAEYHPTYDLKLIAIELADVVAADKYEPDVSVAANLPATWLETNDNILLNKTLPLVQAGASIFGRLRPEARPEQGGHILMIFLVEMADESAARTLLAISKNKRPTDYAMLGLAQGKLFCLIVARNFVAGVRSIETSESLSRFSDGISKVLTKYVPKP